MNGLETTGIKDELEPPEVGDGGRAVHSCAGWFIIFCTGVGCWALGGGWWMVGAGWVVLGAGLTILLLALVCWVLGAG